MDNNYIIGIDLGTTYSCVGVNINGKITIIPNEFGNLTTPSYVSIINDDIIVGQLAKDNALKYPKHTIYNIKRFIGRDFDDKYVQMDMKYINYDIINKDNKPIISIEEKLYTMEEIASFILLKMKDIAEIYLGCKINKAVITVPAYFTDIQRNATKMAGTLANLDVLRIINEPTAAALAYGSQFAMNESNILVYDLGGGTLDITALHIESDIYEVIGTNGDNHLGGEDFDNSLARYIIKDFIMKNKNISVTINDLVKYPNFMKKIKNASENTKCILSSSLSSNIFIECLYNNIDYNCDITRTQFENICKDEFNKCIIPLKSLLSNIESDYKFDKIILIGGSTRIPLISTIIYNQLNIKPTNNIDPDITVAYGATIQANIINQDISTQNVVLLDVNPIDIGIEIENGIMIPIIERNSRIPCTKQKIFSTHINNQPTIDIKIYEGNYTLTKYNTLIGLYKIKGLPAHKKGEFQITIQFHINYNGILDVSIVNGDDNENITITRSYKYQSYGFDNIEE